ncbi:MAG: S1 RNA-binding domain-containing protein [Anaerolineales bacterium]
MSLRSREGLEQEGAPPPPSDAWWQAVLHDPDTNQFASEAGNGDTRRSSANWGSAEDWMWARELYESDDTVHLPVIGYNRGGLLVEAQGLRGFVPVSHLVHLDDIEHEDARCEIMESLVGHDVCLKVIEYDPERGRLVLSQRAAEAGPGKRIELLESLEPGQCVHGEVTNITPFGVFVDLGGVEGLVHVSELSWGRVRHPEDVVCCGEDLEVQVLSVDREQARVALSVKELLPDPWETVENQFKVGDIVNGEVTNVVKFGAFVGIEDGLEGLIHVSEMGEQAHLEPSDVLCEGDPVRVRIINIDAKGRRLGLSLRAVESGADGQGVERDAASEPVSSF